MANDPVAAALSLQVQVCYAIQSEVWRCELTLAPNATVENALAASGFAQQFPGIDPWAVGVGLHGRLVDPGTMLTSGDRIEIYRALNFDPKESRRRRAEHRRAVQAKLGRERPPGLL